MHEFHQRVGSFGLVAASILISMTIPISWAGPGGLNSINNGEVIQSGTYFNSPGSRTTFENTSGGGLVLPTGSLVRGLESNALVPTGNGGTLYFLAPHNTILLNGTVDVSAVRNGSLYTGIGGKVFFDSAYLFQNGSVFANGSNGGLVQYNVGGMTLGPNAKINAQGFGGDGGAVNVNSPGVVNLQTGSVIDTSGKVIGTVDSNVIDIEGSLVNSQGVIHADGLASTDFKPDDGDAAVMAAHPQLANNPVPGPITAGNGTHDTATMTNILFATPPDADFRGGTIRLISSGQTQNSSNVINQTDPLMLSAVQKSALISQNNQLVQNDEGDVLIRGSLSANGEFGKNGGTIIVSAANNVEDSASIQVNGSNAPTGFFDAKGNGASGGNGGTVSFTAMNTVNDSGVIQANGGTGTQAENVNVSTNGETTANATVTGVAGSGGAGGLIAFGAPRIINSGTIFATGAVGAHGGSANSFNLAQSTSSVSNPSADAIAKGGAGGTGGQGGLVVFSSNGNPGGFGSIFNNGGQGGTGGTAFADAQADSFRGTPTATASDTVGKGGAGGLAGTIVTPNPGTFSSTQAFSSKNGGNGTSASGSFRALTMLNGATTTKTGSTASVAGSTISGGNHNPLATRKNEYLRSDDTAILLTEAGGAGTASSLLTGRMNDALIRSVANPNGVSGGGALNDALSADNLVVSSSVSGLSLTNDIVNSNINPQFFNLNTLTFLNNGNITNNTLWTPGVHVVGAGFHDLEISFNGGHQSWLSNGSIVNNQIVISRGLWSGGSVRMAATQDITNNNDIITIADNTNLLQGFTVSGPPYISSHSGSIILQAGQDITNSSTGKIESNQIFFDIHPPLNETPPIVWPTFLNGAQIGATVDLFAHHNLTNAGLIQADALTFRNGPIGAANPALTIGGNINGTATTGTFTNTGTITANGNAFFSSDPNANIFFTTNTFPATTSFNGTISLP